MKGWLNEEKKVESWKKNVMRIGEETPELFRDLFLKLPINGSEQALCAHKWHRVNPKITIYSSLSQKLLIHAMDEKFFGICGPLVRAVEKNWL